MSLLDIWQAYIVGKGVTMYCSTSITWWWYVGKVTTGDWVTADMSVVLWNSWHLRGAVEPVRVDLRGYPRWVTCPLPPRSELTVFWSLGLLHCTLLRKRSFLKFWSDKLVTYLKRFVFQNGILFTKVTFLSDQNFFFKLRKTYFF